MSDVFSFFQLSLLVKSWTSWGRNRGSWALELELYPLNRLSCHNRADCFVRRAGVLLSVPVSVTGVGIVTDKKGNQRAELERHSLHK